MQREAEQPLLVTKGAPEAVILRASRVREGASARPIEASEYERLLKLVDDASDEGFRLVAVGSRTLTSEELRDPTVKGAVALAPDDAVRLERDLARG